MQIGVFSVLFQKQTLDEALTYMTKKGATAVEIGCGGYPGKAHANPKELLNDPKKLEEFKAVIAKHNITISALSCHGNPVHPNKETAKSFHDDFIDAILLAEKLGVDTIVGFSGCPGDGDSSKYPNWVTCPWPEDFSEIFDYQWNDVLIPYWKETAKFAKEHGVNKIALEMHPGFSVYNTATALKLREAVGDIIGVNFDPSHLIWQGMDPVACIKALGKAGAIFHFHAKDTKVDKYNTALNGVLDMQPYANEINRSWIFRSCGYGTNHELWKDMVSALRMVGYEGALSIEHEDSLMSIDEGFTKAIDFLKEIVIAEPVGDIWWA